MSNNSICGLVDLFADGELSPEQADTFRHHLASCGSCGQRLLDHNRLVAVLSAQQSPPIEDKLMDTADAIVNLINSYEQQAIFALIHDGVTFSQIKLWRTVDPMEQGIMVNGTNVCTITVTWPSLQDLIFKPAVAIVQMKFLEPYLHLNARVSKH